MAEYISTFTTGFSDIIPSALRRLLPDVRVLKVYDGLVYYSYEGDAYTLTKVFFLNNTFVVIGSFLEKKPEIDEMVKSIISLKELPKVKKSFRVRFSVNNQFVSVNKRLVGQLEDKVCKLTNGRVDRVSPQTEYWFIKRSENVGFFARLITKRRAIEKELNKGELRPEFAYLMCMLGELEHDSIVMDPFVGYGSIPKQIKKYFPYKTIYVSDKNEEQISKLKSDLKESPKIRISVGDALHMDNIASTSIDTIITDPPWGYYEDVEDIEEFYVDMISEFLRVIKKGGKIVVLSARKIEFERAIQTMNLSIKNKFDTLVNGKKAAVYVIDI